jgi:hypothetical protein
MALQAEANAYQMGQSSPMVLGMMLQQALPYFESNFGKRHERTLALKNVIEGGGGGGSLGGLSLPASGESFQDMASRIQQSVVGNYIAANKGGAPASKPSEPSPEVSAALDKVKAATQRAHERKEERAAKRAGRKGGKQEADADDDATPVSPAEAEVPKAQVNQQAAVAEAVDKAKSARERAMERKEQRAAEREARTAAKETPTAQEPMTPKQPAPVADIPEVKKVAKHQKNKDARHKSKGCTIS